MERGKRICKVMKELRKRIADANEIPYVIEECPYKGDCLGTCPKCEADLRYLTEAIDAKEKQGKTVTIEGLMSEEELRQAFSIEPVNEKPEELVLAGLPISEESEHSTLKHTDMESKGEHMIGEPMMYSYDFAAIIAGGLMRNTDNNFVFSPTGLCRILDMLSMGMDVNSNLFFEECRLTDCFNSSIESYNNEYFKLEHAASIWYNRKLGAIKQDYLDSIRLGYEAEAHNADFTQKSQTKLRIDKWVSDKTHQMITELDTELSDDALMVVLDAIYMNGKWKNPFDPDLTEQSIFRNSNGTEADVDMMCQEIGEADYGETDEYQVISLPYKGSGYSMVVVLPKKNSCIENIMANTDWLEAETAESDVQLYMPRFDFDNTLSFVDVLTKLGLKDMFESEHSFPDITDLPAHISDIKQQCVIKVEEQGTKAAAITMEEFVLGCCPPDDIPEPITMKLDRPFGFAIRGEFDELLFMGVVKKMDDINDSTI